MRRMYARLLFVVVGIFRPVLTGFKPKNLYLSAIGLALRLGPALRLGIAGRGGYTLRHE